MQEESRKIRYTKRIIKESFLSLLKEKPFSKVTVRELCIRADISRGTFYQHYEDIYHLLESLENNLYQKIFSSENTITKPLSEIIQVLYDDKDFCCVLLSENGDPSFLEKIIYTYKTSELQKNDSVRKKSAKPEYLYNFNVGGSISVIRTWANHGFLESPETITEYIQDFCGDKNTLLKKL